MSRELVISVDYEIFGNGTGDVRQHMTQPTERMARICEAHGAPLTVFFEVEEYLAFERHREELIQSLGYDPAAEIRAQIKSFVQRGHDIQLHLHPEWYGARLEAGQWALRMDRQTVDSLFEAETEACGYIAERKAVIDEILAEAGSSERVSVYRAGAFSAQPGKKLIGALRANGITIDSSVVQGLTRQNAHVRLDYRNAPCRKGPWRVTNDVAVEDSAGDVWEYPIYSVMGRRWQQATLGRLKAKFSRNVPKHRQKQMVHQLGLSRNPIQLLKFLFQPAPIKLDYHNLTPTKLLSYIRTAPLPKSDLPDVLISIGHSKEHLHDESFSEFLRLVTQESNVNIVGFGSVTRATKALEALV